MAEDEKRPALKEIPVREIKSNFDSERQIISLMNSLKDNFDAKLVALRKDLEQKTHEQVANEIIKIQDAMEKLRSTNDEAQKAISDQVTALAEKLNQFTAASPDENAKFKQEVQVTLEKVQALTSKFDLTLFVNEIRGSFSSKLEQAEFKAKELAEQVEKSQQESDQLKKALAEKELKAKQEIEQLKRDLAAKDSEPRRMQQSTPVAAAPLSRISPIPSQPSTAPYLQRNPSPLNGPGNSSEDQTDQGKKPVQYCKNCGKARNRTAARFCIYCGSEF